MITGGPHIPGQSDPGTLTGTKLDQAESNNFPASRGEFVVRKLYLSETEIKPVQTEVLYITDIANGGHTWQYRTLARKDDDETTKFTVSFGNGTELDAGQKRIVTDAGRVITFEHPDKQGLFDVVTEIASSNPKRLQVLNERNLPGLGENEKELLAKVVDFVEKNLYTSEIQAFIDVFKRRYSEDMVDNHTFFSLFSAEELNKLIIDNNGGGSSTNELLEMRIKLGLEVMENPVDQGLIRALSQNIMNNYFQEFDLSPIPQLNDISIHPAIRNGLRMKLLSVYLKHLPNYQDEKGIELVKRFDVIGDTLLGMKLIRTDWTV